MEISSTISILGLWETGMGIDAIKIRMGIDGMIARVGKDGMRTGLDIEGIIQGSDSPTSLLIATAFQVRVRAHGCQVRTDH